ncbi:hypothetical protein M413DRAFT_446369 [Hebeloma cylindrosporum]|uniref:Uncharacterized protein n=1 Tax=Hebeloma cylindrosporum TaxID=76867 RepID=A0A0C3C7M1_HEBCY|nr:hypothetical protein M413DRAFT_446369 [Hebeloma cylindrosporum h7]
MYCPIFIYPVTWMFCQNTAQIPLITDKSFVSLYADYVHKGSRKVGFIHDMCGNARKHPPRGTAEVERC